MPYKVTGAGSAQGGPIAAAPCTPRLWRTKSPLRDSLSLSLAATGSGARERPCKMRPRRASMRVAPASRERFGDFDATNTRAVFL
ncbi:hypothetical protein AJR19_004625 [Shigella dysenteriae]|nr:hypothetical protein AJR20_006680 [Shigella dysenteriae]OOO94619.1 hypothetical protein AJR19_004625 [Shigella dysenteriae]